MQFRSISFNPIAHIRFTAAQIRVLIKLSESHYDAKCRGLSTPDRGLLIKVKNYHRNTSQDETPAFYKFTRDDIDTLAKTSEGAQFLLTTKEREIGFDLGWRFHQIIRALSEHRPEDVEIDQDKLPGPWNLGNETDKPSPTAIAAVGATMHLFNTGTVLEDRDGREVTALWPSDDGTYLMAEFDHDDAEAFDVKAVELHPRENRKGTTDVRSSTPLQQSLFASPESASVHACGDPGCIVPHPAPHKRPPATTEEIVVAQQVSPARASDPETSHEAADAWPEIRGQQRVAVFRFLCLQGTSGATDYAIAAALKIQRTSAGKRRKELLDLGYVIETDRRASTDTGASAIVWQIHPLVLQEPQKARVIEP